MPLPASNPELRHVLRANFAGLDLDVAALEDVAVPLRRLPSGRTLFAQGQPMRAFYAVLSGEIEARFIESDGAVSVLEHVQAPRLFGLAAFAAERPASYEAVARSSSRVLVFDAIAYDLLINRLPGFAKALLREFAQRHDSTLQLLEAARHQSAAERFNLALVQLARERATEAPDAQGWQHVNATQAELAAVANLSRQTVNQLLRQASTGGRVKSGYGRLWIRR